MSVLEYFQNSHQRLDNYTHDQYHLFNTSNYIDHIRACFSNPTAVFDSTPLEAPCLSSWGGPVQPYTCLGGFNITSSEYGNATALILTFVVNNSKDAEHQKKALAWEKGFIEFMKSYDNPMLTIAFTAERSIEDEINRESSSDVKTIVISYLVMFVYVAVALGQFRSLSTIMVDSKVTMGIGGVLIVLLSVLASLGCFSFAGVSVTLIIIEVIPFLVLAVGVDNIFILVQSYQRSVRLNNERRHEHIGRIVGEVGPTMLLSSLSESLAFFLGTLSSMPAVKDFSMFAGLAIIFNFLLQITSFVGLLALDSARTESGRCDVLCCVTSHESNVLDGGDEEGRKGSILASPVYYVFKHVYAPRLLSKWVRPVIIVIFAFLLCLSIAFIPHVDIGLDQQLSMPEDSYVLKWFAGVDKYLSVGAPVYFVVTKGLNYTLPAHQNLVCGGTGCPQESVLGQLYQASLQYDYSRIAHPASSWLDDYISWSMSRGNPPCCRVYARNDSFCNSTVVVSDACKPCDIPRHLQRPLPSSFMRYFPYFMRDNPGVGCSKGGHAAYGTALNYDDTNVFSSYFMTYHTVLKTSADFIDALEKARQIAANMTATIRRVIDDVEVFPYSVFYVFYEQYLTIIKQTWIQLVASLTGVFLITFLLLGINLHAAFIVVFIISCILCNMFGVMYAWNISLNAVSLVNLVICCGISVEFCSHIIRSFTLSIKDSKVERAEDALARMGSSVFSGITITKFSGISVLAFSNSQMFQVFFFRMYLAIVLLGFAYGLILLPVLLSYIGPGVNKKKVYDAQLERRGERSAVNGVDSIVNGVVGGVDPVNGVVGGVDPVNGVVGGADREGGESYDREHAAVT